MKISRDPVVVGGNDRERRQQRDDRRRRDDIAPPRPAPLRRDLVAKQRRHRNVVGAPERPQREGERGEQTIGERQHEHGRDRAPAQPATE